MKSDNNISLDVLIVYYFRVVVFFLRMSTELLKLNYFIELAYCNLPQFITTSFTLEKVSFTGSCPHINCNEIYT